MAKRDWEEIIETVKGTLTEEEGKLIVHCVRSVYMSTKRKVVSREHDEYFSFLTQEALINFWRYDADKSEVPLEKFLVFSLLNRGRNFRRDMYRHDTHYIMEGNQTDAENSGETSYLNSNVLKTEGIRGGYLEVESFIDSLSERDSLIVKYLINGVQKKDIQKIMNISRVYLDKYIDGIIEQAGYFGFSIQTMKKYELYLKRQQKRGKIA